MSIRIEHVRNYFFGLCSDISGSEEGVVTIFVAEFRFIASNEEDTAKLTF